MDFDVETHFVKNSVKKEYQERILFELKSKKHREKAISRFSHSANIILNSKFSKYSLEDLISISFQKGNTENCYIISNGLHDGEHLSLEEAVKYCQQSYMTVILISSKFTAVKEEYEKSSPWVFVSIV